jgi:predicted GNAT superfamily acetyltransferase
MAGDFPEIEALCPGFSLRRIADQAGYRRCVDLQIQVWNYSDPTEVVPAAFLAITPHLGGILLGAYDSRRRMVGFAYSIPGFHRGRLVQHSHMLGVLPGYRNRSIGLALKLAQRQLALHGGMKQVVWTYDPLQAANAHFNINLLGVWVDSYEVNLYGRSSSELHRGMDTDRFLAIWDLNSAGVRNKVRLAARRDSSRPAMPLLPVINPMRFDDNNLPHPTRSMSYLRESCFLFELPADIARLKAEQPASARGAQRQLRQACGYYFSRGYCVTRFFSDPQTLPMRSFYLFEKR